MPAGCHRFPGCSQGARGQGQADPSGAAAAAATGALIRPAARPARPPAQLLSPCSSFSVCATLRLSSHCNLSNSYSSPPAGCWPVAVGGGGVLGISAASIGEPSKGKGLPHPHTAARIPSPPPAVVCTLRVAPATGRERRVRGCWGGRQGMGRGGCGAWPAGHRQAAGRKGIAAPSTPPVFLLHYTFLQVSKSSG